jgi:hypothetical protein
LTVNDTITDEKEKNTTVAGSTGSTGYRFAAKFCHFVKKMLSTPRIGIQNKIKHINYSK